jgi:hypothetical protein
MNPAYAILEDLNMDPSHLPIPDPVAAPEELTSCKAFKDWFQQSSVTTPAGAPLMVFHGTSREDRRFNSSRHVDLEGAYFTPSFKAAKQHAHMDSEVECEQPYVIAAFIRINNPFVMDGYDSQVLSTEQVKGLITNGYDGVFGVEEDGSVGEYVVFDPSQIAQFHDGVIELPNIPVDLTIEAAAVKGPDAENASPALPVFYHGTTRKAWRKRHEDPSYLNLTSSLEDAERYASESGEAEYEDCGRSHPVVMKISPSALELLLTKPGVELQPDWGWVEGQEHDARKGFGTFTDADATWQNSLEKCSGIGIGGFRNKFKKAFELAVDLALEQESPAP